MNGKVLLADVLVGVLIMSGCMSLEERLASSDYATRKDAETELYQNAIRQGSQTEVKNAVNRMTCPDLLAAVASSKNHPSEITKLAVGKISEDKWLSAVAVYATDADVQNLAIAKMNDQALLLAVYKNLKCKDLRIKVIERLDSESLAKIPYSSEFAAQWKKISNQAILAKIISNDLAKVPESEWSELIGRVTDEREKNNVQLSLAYVYAKEYGGLSDEVRGLLVNSINDKAIIEEMVTEPDRNEINREKEQRNYARKMIQRKIQRAESDVEEWKKFVRKAEEKWHFNDAKKNKERLAKCEKELESARAEERAFLASAPKHIYVDDEEARAPLYGKLGDEFLVKYADEMVKKLDAFHEDGSSARWDAINGVVAKMVKSDNKIKYYSKILSEIARDEKESDGKSWSAPIFGLSGTNHKWSRNDEIKAQMFVDAWKLDEHPDVVEKLIAGNVPGWKYLMKYTTPTLAEKMLRGGMIKGVGLQIAMIKKMNAQSIDMALYNSIPNDDVRKVMMTRMPASARKDASKANAKQIEELLAKAVSSGTFNLKGFYLGMQIEDAKRLASYYLPDSRIVITRDNDIEIDVSHGGDFDVTPMYFCRADRSGRVYLFNFDEKRFLKKWFKYDVQSYGEWAAEFGKEFGCDFRKRTVKGKRDVKDVWIRVSQDVFQFRNNSKGYMISYFGEKDIFDPNGEVSLSSIIDDAQFSSAQDAMFRAGLIKGARLWVKNGWENADGAREGTLRIQEIKD